MEQIHLLNSKQDEHEQILSSNSDGQLLAGDKDGKRKSGHRRWKSGMPKNEGTAMWGLTAFSDMSKEEFTNEYLDPGFKDRVLKMKKSKKHHKNNDQENSNGNLLFNNLIKRKKRAALPKVDKVNWLTKGIVTPVKHQKSCGACWAFSSVETVESMNALQKGTLEELSVQQVDFFKKINLIIIRKNIWHILDIFA